MKLAIEVTGSSGGTLSTAAKELEHTHAGQPNPSEAPVSLKTPSRWAKNSVRRTP